MKSFKEHYLTESAKEEEELVLLDCLRAIINDCQQFLHKVAANGKFHPLFRNISASHWPNWEVKVRKGRPSLSTDEHINDSLKRAFEEEYGNDFKTTAMFASGKAKGENVHLIFPIGRFDYLWSEDQKDLYDALTNSENDGELYWDMHKAESDDERDKMVKAFLKDNKFIHNKELQKAADQGHEIMIDCKYYYVIPLSIVEEHYETFKAKLGELNIKKK